MISISDFRSLKSELQATVALVQALAKQVDELQARIIENEQRRGPGRPPKEGYAHR